MFFIFDIKKARGEILAKQWLIGELQLLKYWGFIIPSIKVTINILQHNILVYVNINRFNILITLCEIGCTEIKDIILEILCIMQNKKRPGGKILVMHKNKMGETFIVCSENQFIIHDRK